MGEQAIPHDTAPRRDGIIRWWDLAIAFFGGTFAGGVLVALAGVAAILVAMRHGFHPTAENLTAVLRTSFAANLAALFISDLGLVGTVWLVARWRFERPLTHYFPPVAARDLLLALLSGLALSLLLNGGNELLSRGSLIQFHDSDIERAMVPHGAAQIAVAVLGIGLFAPFVEEFFFRGLLFGWLRQRLGLWLSTGLSGLLFALAHGHMFIHPGLQGWLFSAELFLAGIVLAWWVARTGSLRASFALHAAYNAAAVAFSVLLP